jgi:hypothetical protein
MKETLHPAASQAPPTKQPTEPAPRTTTCPFVPSEVEGRC